MQRKYACHFFCVGAFDTNYLVPITEAIKNAVAECLMILLTILKCITQLKQTDLLLGEF